MDLHHTSAYSKLAIVFIHQIATSPLTSRTCRASCFTKHIQYKEVILSYAPHERASYFVFKLLATDGNTRLRHALNVRVTSPWDTPINSDTNLTPRT